MTEVSAIPSNSTPTIERENSVVSKTRNFFDVPWSTELPTNSLSEHTFNLETSPTKSQKCVQEILRPLDNTSIFIPAKKNAASQMQQVQPLIDECVDSHALECSDTQTSHLLVTSAEAPSQIQQVQPLVNERMDSDALERSDAQASHLPANSNDPLSQIKEMQALVEEYIGAHTIEILDATTSHLPPNSYEVRMERTSPTTISLTARSFDGELPMISIIFELIRLGIKHEECDRFWRQQQQKSMLVHMMNVVENLANQGKMILYACIAAGVLGIVGGLLPIIGLMKGNAILGKLSKWFTSLKDAKQEKIFMPLSRSLDAASRTTQMGKESQQTQAESIKVREESYSKREEIRNGESTRLIEDKNRKKESYQAMLDRLMEAHRQLIQAICR